MEFEATSSSRDVTIWTHSGGYERGHRDGSSKEALFDRPVGVAVTSTGDIIVVDTFNHRIRIVDQQTGHTRTLSGSGKKGLADGAATDAMFHNPGAISVGFSPFTGEEVTS